ADEEAVLQPLEEQGALEEELQVGEGGRLLEPEGRGGEVVEIVVALEGSDDHPVEGEEHHEEIGRQGQVRPVVALDASPARAHGGHSLRSTRSMRTTMTARKGKMKRVMAAPIPMSPALMPMLYA